MGALLNKHIVLGLSGGIACYKSAELCRALVKQGATVQVVMTEAAAQFITPVTMQALSNRPVFVSQWDAREPNNMAHINLTREADAVVVAPASADFIAKLALYAGGKIDLHVWLNLALCTFTALLVAIDGCRIVEIPNASHCDFEARPSFLCHRLTGSKPDAARTATVHKALFRESSMFLKRNTPIKP